MRFNKYILIILLVLVCSFLSADTSLNISDDLYQALSGVWRTPNSFIQRGNFPYEFSWGQSNISFVELYIDLGAEPPIISGTEIYNIHQEGNMVTLFLRPKRTQIPEIQEIRINDDGSIILVNNNTWGPMQDGPYYKYAGPNAHEVEYVLSKIEDLTQRNAWVEIYNEHIREPGEPRIEFREDSSQNE